MTQQQLPTNQHLVTGQHPSPDIVICGAGFAGVSAAYHLAVKQGLPNIVLVDERPPLGLTSSKGTECYRNWWPGPGDTMVRFMNRSIDLLEELAHESGNIFQMNRRGYVFLTADPARAAGYADTAAEFSRYGAGPVRPHSNQQERPTYIPPVPEGFQNQPTGADIVLDKAFIRQQFPFINSEAQGMLHARRCGWFNSKQYGAYLLAQAQKRGVRVVHGRVEKVEVANGRVEAVHIQELSGFGKPDRPERLPTRCFVIAAGPHLKQVGAMLGLDLPVFNELHGKITFEDSLGIIPRDVPLMIWDDPIKLPWSEAERQALSRQEASRPLLAEFPAGIHFRPMGGPDSRQLWILWTYHVESQEPVWPPTFDPDYAEVVIRGMARMIPAFSAYFGQGERAIVDGGYYCKTAENRPLIGPLPVAGAYVIGALSGYGLMGSQAAAELLAAHVTGGKLPDYAAAFLLSRYEDPDYQAQVVTQDALAGQL